MLLNCVIEWTAVFSDLVGFGSECEWLVALVVGSLSL